MADLRHVRVDSTEDRQEWIPVKHRNLEKFITAHEGLRIIYPSHVFQRLNWPHDWKHPNHPGIAKVLTPATKAMAEFLIKKIQEKETPRIKFQYLYNNTFYTNAKSEKNRYGVIVYILEPVRGRLDPNEIGRIKNWTLHVKTVTSTYIHSEYGRVISGRIGGNRFVDLGNLTEDGMELETEAEPPVESKDGEEPIEGTDFELKLEETIARITVNLDVLSNRQRQRINRQLNNLELAENNAISLKNLGPNLLTIIDRAEGYMQGKKFRNIEVPSFNNIRTEIQRWQVPDYLKSPTINKPTLDNIQKSWWTILKEIAFPAKNLWQDIIEEDELDKYDIPIENFTGAVEDGKLTSSARASLDSLDLMLNGMEDAIEIYKETQESTTGFLRSMMSRIKDIDEVEIRIKKARKIYNNSLDKLDNLKKIQLFKDIIEPKPNQSEKEYVLLVLNKAYQDFLSDSSEENARILVFISDFGMSKNKKLSPQHEALGTATFEKTWLTVSKIKDHLKNRDEEKEEQAFNSIWTTAEQKIVERIRNIFDIKQKSRRAAPVSVTEAIGVAGGLEASMRKPSELASGGIRKLKLGSLAEDATTNFREWQKLEAIIIYLIKDETLMVSDNPLYFWKDKPRSLEFLMSIYRNPRTSGLKVRQFTMGLRGIGSIRGGQSKRAWAMNTIVNFTKSRTTPNLWGEDLITQERYSEKIRKLTSLNVKNNDLSDKNNLLSFNNINKKDAKRLKELREKYGDTTELTIKEANLLSSLQDEVNLETKKRHRAATKGMQLANSEQAEDYRNFVTTYSKLFERFKGRSVTPEEFANAMKEEGQPIDDSLLEMLSPLSEEFNTDDFTKDIDNDLVLNLIREMLITFINTNSKADYVRHMSDFFEPEGDEDYIGDISEFVSTDPDAFPKAFATWLTIYEQILGKGKGMRNALSKAIIEDFPRNVEKEATGRQLKRRTALLNNLDVADKESVVGILPTIERLITEIENDISHSTEGIRATLQDTVKEMLNTIAGNVSSEGAGSTSGIKIKSGKTRKGASKRIHTTVRNALLEYKYLVPEE